MSFADSNSKKSCQGCELPSDDVPDSTSNSRGQNNNTPSATNNNQSNVNERTNGVLSRATPNSTIELGAQPNAANVISNADSSVASTVSLEEEEESPVKIKKKEEGNSRKVSWIMLSWFKINSKPKFESLGEERVVESVEFIPQQRHLP